MDYTREVCDPSSTCDAWFELVMTGGEGTVGRKTFSGGFSGRKLEFDC
jgi:hypothetical protein